MVTITGYEHALQNRNADSTSNVAGQIKIHTSLASELKERTLAHSVDEGCTALLTFLLLQRPR